MSKALIISGHPHLNTSIANSSIIRVLQKELNLDLLNIAFKYPNYEIDVQQETILNPNSAIFHVYFLKII